MGTVLTEGMFNLLTISGTHAHGSLTVGIEPGTFGSQAGMEISGRPFARGDWINDRANSFKSEVARPFGELAWSRKCLSLDIV